ncbi:MAG: YHS domain-containing (seleno)protein [Myxococcota bacterium]
MIDRRAVMLGLAVALWLPSTSWALDPIFADKGVAIRGADPVAYFTEGAYKAGLSEFTTKWRGAVWRFTSAAHRDRFVASPERYAPQYGGYCAYAVSQGRTASIDPNAFTVVGDKLYLNYSKSIEKTWRADRDAYIKQADANWPKLRDGKK